MSLEPVGVLYVERKMRVDGRQPWVWKRKRREKGTGGGILCLCLCLQGWMEGWKARARVRVRGGDKKKRKEWGTSNHIHSCTNTPG